MNTAEYKAICLFLCIYNLESLMIEQMFALFIFMLKYSSPGRDVDVFEQAGEAVSQGDAERPQQVVPVRLHVLTGPALGVTLTAHVLVVGSHDVWDEVVVTTGSLEGQRKKVRYGYIADIRRERQEEEGRKEMEG